MSCKQPPTLPTCSKINPTHDEKAETTFCGCLLQRAPLAALPSCTCSAKSPLHFTPVSISRWMLFLLCCSDASAQGSPSAYSTRFSMHAEQLQQQHLIELLHAARSAAFYIKQTYFCRSSIVTWQNLERFPLASPGYSFIPLLSLRLTHRNRTSVAERAGRYSLYL